MLWVCLVASTLIWIRRPGDFAGYLTVGELALAGRHIYHDAPPSMNTWPPFFSLWCVPLALLARPTPYLARGCWLILNFALLRLIFKLLAQMVYKHHSSLTLASPELLLPLVVCARFVLSNFDHLQVNIVIFALTLSGVYWLTRDRPWTAGVLIGVAAALKVMPLVFVPYFAYRRRFKTAAAVTITTALCSLAPILVYGPTRFVDYMHAWRESVARGWGVGKMNQSLYAMFDRSIGHGITLFHPEVQNHLPSSGDPSVLLATAVVLGLIAGAALWLFRGEAVAASSACLQEYATVFTVSAIAGPVTWKAYLVVLLFPSMLLTREALDPTTTPERRQVSRWILAAAFVFGGVAAPALVGNYWAGAAAMLSDSTWAALILLGSMLWLRATQPTTD